jgi:hypothetical protein
MTYNDKNGIELLSDVENDPLGHCTSSFSHAPAVSKKPTRFWINAVVVTSQIQIIQVVCKIWKQRIGLVETS